MKQKLLCMIFAILMVFSLAACGSSSEKTADKGTDDFASFLKVQKSMSDIKDMEFKLDMTASVPDEDHFQLAMKGTGKEIFKSKDDVQMAMDYDMNTGGNSLKGSMYMKDNTVYMDMLGQKIKVNAKEETAAMMNIDTEALFAITKDMVSDLAVTEDGDDTVYTFKLDVNKAMDYFSKNAGTAKQLTEASTEDVTFDKMNVTITAGKDNVAKNLKMDCSMGLKSGSDAVNMDYTLSMDYVSINTGLTIDFPDFSGYKKTSV